MTTGDDNDALRRDLRANGVEFFDDPDAPPTLDSYDPVPAGEMPLDPGIRRYVLILRSEGIETIQSCQGAGRHDTSGHFRADGSSHCCPEPTVIFVGNAFEGFRAFAIAMTYGLPVRAIMHEYDVVDGRLVGPQWRMTFRHADPEVASGKSLAVVTLGEAARA